MIADNPLHGSGQGGFPHPALALGDDAHASQGIGMTGARQRQPASEEAPHAIPEDTAILAAPRQHAMPEPSHLESDKLQRRCVHGHSVIPDVSTHRAGFQCTSRYRCITGWGLPLSPTASASQRKVLTRLNTRPARSPLSTLRRHSCEWLRMTRGRCGSLIHFRMTFAFTTPRRFSRRTGDTP